METLVAACGLVCSKCDAYIGTKNYDYDLICKTAVEWGKLHSVNIKAEEVWCNGCMTDGGPKCAHCGSGCEIRVCVKEKKYDTCADCSSYPCSKVDFLIKGVPSTKVLIDAFKEC